MQPGNRVGNRRPLDEHEVRLMIILFHIRKDSLVSHSWKKIEQTGLKGSVAAVYWRLP
jgi:hypothetical protein